MYAPVSGTVVLDSNVVSGSRTYGLYLSAPAGTSVTGQWNNVTDNRTYGICTTGTATFSFTNGPRRAEREQRRSARGQEIPNRP